MAFPYSISLLNLQNWLIVLAFCFLFQISGPVLDESQVKSIVEEIKQVITASSSRKRERAERAKAEDFDAEEGELIKEENEQEEEVFDQVSYWKYCLKYHIFNSANVYWVAFFNTYI